MVDRAARSRPQNDRSGHQDRSIRKSEQVWIFDVDDPFIASISTKISKVTNTPVSHQEALQIVHYGVGGKYEPHYDACREQCDRMNGKSGRLRFLNVKIIRKQRRRKRR